MKELANPAKKDAAEVPGGFFYRLNRLQARVSKTELVRRVLLHRQL